MRFVRITAVVALVSFVAARYKAGDLTEEEFNKLTPEEQSDYLHEVMSPFPKDPVRDYIQDMCFPLTSNKTLTRHASPLELSDILRTSEFPCEHSLYIQEVCVANGTSQLDFEAEQQCICNGAYWDLVRGCDSCWEIHGVGQPGVNQTAYREYTNAFSRAYCDSPAYQPLSNFIPVSNTATFSTAALLTLSNDRFPNQTATSNYFTATQALTPGEITGSATRRLQSWTNFDGLRFTPTTTPSGVLPLPTLPVAVTVQSTSIAGTPTPATTQPGNNAGTPTLVTTQSGNNAAESAVPLLMAAVGLGLALL